jgi:cytochrome c oxidase subunit 4
MAHDPDTPHVVSVGTYVAVFLALLVLTGVTVWAAGHDFGNMNTLVALGIATTKAVLVVLFFMHVKYSSRLTQIVVGAAFLWLTILVVGTLHDYYAPQVNQKVTEPTLHRD